MKRNSLKFVLLFCVASLFVGVKCDQWLLENDDLELNRLIACAAECLTNESGMVTNKMPILEMVHHHCFEKEIAVLEPVLEIKSSDTVQLICRDADAVVISVQSNPKSKANDVNSTGELYLVKIVASGDGLPTKMIYMVSDEREKKNLRKKFNLIGFVFYLQSDSAHVKLEGLASDESFNVTVGIVNAKREYRILPDIEVRTLPSMAYRPQTIPSESITLSDFSTDEDPNSLSAYVQWTPADGKDIFLRVLSQQN